MMDQPAGAAGQAGDAAGRARRGWQPVLAGAAAGEAIAIAEEIAAALTSRALDGAAAPGHPPEEADHTLSGGSAGIAVFLAYLDAARPGRGHGERAMAYLEEAFDWLCRSAAPPWLFAGFPGVAWAFEHLRDRLGVAGDDDPGEDVARLIAEFVATSPWQDPVELVGGVTGLGVYALERGSRAHGAECLARAVARVAETAERREDGITWRSRAARLAPPEHGGGGAGEHDLGLSHGVPGVVAFLGEAAARGSREARALLPGAVRWLLAQKLPAGSPSVFPRAVAPRRAPTPTRLAWCYGDLGISLALLGTARRAGEPAWEQEALDLARSAAGRPIPRGYPVQPGLCHGTAGVAHLFNRLHQATGDPLFVVAARSWFARTLEMRRPGTGIAGFAAWLTGDSGEITWHAEPGILTGAAGVGLALLAAATACEPAWDRMLLVSVPA